MTDSPMLAPLRSPRGLEFFAAVLLALLLTALVDRFTGVMSPKWDSLSYVDMARNGVWGNDHLVAPYAYRPGMPWLARQVADALSWDLSTAFLWVCRFFVAAFLFMSLLLARRFAASPWKAAIPVLFAAAFVMPVKFALFVPTSVDVAAYPLMLLAVWAWVGGRLGLCLAVSAVGLFFKEFLAIPILLCLFEYGRLWRGDRSPKRLWTFAGACLLGAAVILIPRLGLPVAETQQEIDPLNNVRSLPRLVMNPLNLARDFNILFCIADFWLPCLLLGTRERWREARTHLEPFRNFILGFVALNLLLVMYGGTNLSTFVAYSAPLQLAVLARLVSQGRDPVRAWEWMLALTCIVIYNRVFFAIPQPDEGFEAYNDFYAGWGDVVNRATFRRCAEMAGYAILMLLAKRAGRGLSRRGPNPIPG